jgi:type II secretory pathway pseudopilin PulG
MIVVAIMAVLAGIATPLYMRYLYRSKATEVVRMFATFQFAQEAWRALPDKRFCPVSASDVAWFPSANPGSSQQSWPADANWRRMLGKYRNFRSSYFSYVVVAGDPGTRPTDFGFSDDRGIVGNDAWYIARALGDLDGDTTLADSPNNITFESSSENRRIWASNPDGWE